MQIYKGPFCDIRPLAKVSLIQHNSAVLKLASFHFHSMDAASHQQSFGPNLNRKSANRRHNGHSFQQNGNNFYEKWLNKPNSTDNRLRLK